MTITLHTWTSDDKHESAFAHHYIENGSGFPLMKYLSLKCQRAC